MINLSDSDLARWLGEVFWPFLRILGLFSAAPLFNAIAIPARAKVALALAIALLLAPAIGQSAPLSLSWGTLRLVVEQVLIGLTIGFAMQLALTAMAFAGDLIGVQMGFGFAGLFDIQSRFSVPVMSELFSLIGLLLFVTMNGHLLVLGVLVKSFEVIPVTATAGIGSAGRLAVAQAGAALFQLGMWLALPVVAVLLVANVAVAVVSRVAPQINLMSIGFSIFMWVGLAATIALVPFFAPAVEHMIEAGLTTAGAALQRQ